MSEDPKLVSFPPEHVTPSPNGSRLRRRRSPSPTGILFGLLAGGVVAASLVGRVQWLNLANPNVGSWWRLVVPAAVAGLVAPVWRRGATRTLLIEGAIAGVLTLWIVYAMVRISTPVVFVDRSVTRVVAFDLLRLAAHAIPAGVAGAGLVAAARAAAPRAGRRDR